MNREKNIRESNSDLKHYSGRMGNFEYDPNEFEICIMQKEHNNSRGHVRKFDTETLVYLGSESDINKIKIPNGFDLFVADVITISDLESHVKKLDEESLRHFVEKNPHKKDFVNDLTDFDVNKHPNVYKKADTFESKRDHVISLFEDLPPVSDKSISDD